MIAIRIVGVLFGIALLLIAARVYTQGRSRRLDFLLWFLVSSTIIAVGSFPQLLGFVLNPLDFRREDNRQLIGVLVLSNLLLFLLFFRTSGLASAAHRDITRLTRALAQREYRQQTHALPEGADIVVVIPAYNEEATIGKVLEGLPRETLGRRVDALVVVDGGKDATEAVTRKHGIPAVQAINRGQGAALLTGYELAAERGASVIVITDADGQTDPSELPALVAPILNDEADFVNGSRRLGRYEPEGFIRPLGVKIFSFLVSILVQRRVTDVSSPFRAFRAGAVPTLALHQDQFQASELLIEAIRKGLRYKEVGITMRRRPVGKSKKPSFHRYGFGFAKAIIQTWLR